MVIKLFYRWYDMWIGFYYDRKEKTLYFCILGFGIKFQKKIKECPDSLDDLRRYYE